MFGRSTALFPQATIVSHFNPPCNVDQFSGGSREGARGAWTPLIFRPKWGPKGRKNYFGDCPPPYLMVWMTAPPLLSDGLDPPLQFAVCRSRFPRFVHVNGKITLNISILPYFQLQKSRLSVMEGGIFKKWQTWSINGPWNVEQVDSHLLLAR